MLHCWCTNMAIASYFTLTGKHNFLNRHGAGLVFAFSSSVYSNGPSLPQHSAQQCRCRQGEGSICWSTGFQSVPSPRSPWICMQRIKRQIMCYYYFSCLWCCCIFLYFHFSIPLYILLGIASTLSLLVLKYTIEIWLPHLKYYKQCIVLVYSLKPGHGIAKCSHGNPPEL